MKIKYVVTNWVPTINTWFVRWLKGKSLIWLDIKRESTGRVKSHNRATSALVFPNTFKGIRVKKKDRTMRSSALTSFLRRERKVPSNCANTRINIGNPIQMANSLLFTKDAGSIPGKLDTKPFERS